MIHVSFYFGNNTFSSGLLKLLLSTGYLSYTEIISARICCCSMLRNNTHGLWVNMNHSSITVEWTVAVWLFQGRVFERRKWISANYLKIKGAKLTFAFQVSVSLLVLRCYFVDSDEFRSAFSWSKILYWLREMWPAASSRRGDSLGAGDEHIWNTKQQTTTVKPWTCSRFA